MNWDVFVFVGLAIALPTFLYGRSLKERAKIKRLAFLGSSMLAIAICLAIVSVQSLRAGVASAGFILGVIAGVWFLMTLSALRREAKDILDDLRRKRRRERDNAMKNRAENYYNALKPEQQAQLYQEAEAWWTSIGGAGRPVRRESSQRDLSVEFLIHNRFSNRESA